MRVSSKFVVWLSSLMLLLSLGIGCGGSTEQTCQNDDDCMDQMQCRNNKCVSKDKTTCKSNSDCQKPTPICDIDTGKCKAECTANTDCAQGYVCKEGVCHVEQITPECVWDRDCGPGKICGADGKCQDAATKECYTDSDCVNKAHRFCSTNNTCAWDCKSDRDCGDGYRCLDYRCKQSDICRDHDDCKLPTGKCDPDTRKCVQCLANADCPADKVCLNKICQDKPGCQRDADCRTPTPKCEIATGKCRECLDEKDCPTREKCEQFVCKAVVGCHPPCASGEYCFVSERCIPEWQTCTADTECQSDQICLDPGSGKVCLTKCDPSKNQSKEDRSNSACYSGYGYCLITSESDPTQGVCLPPYKKTRAWKEACLNLGSPQKADYHDCKDADTLCVRDENAAFCWKKCDPKKNTNPAQPSINPDCENGQGVCHPMNDGGGVCEPVRPKTQKIGENCLDQDPTKPTWNDCTSGSRCIKNVCVEATQSTGQQCNNTDKLCKDDLLCLMFDRAQNLALCKQKCNPTAPKCPSSFECLGVSQSDPNIGACIEQRDKTRKTGESCGGNDPTKPEWHLCAQDAPCNNGICGLPRNATREKGNSCELTDPNDPGYHTCKSGLHCWNKTCVNACDPATGGCAASEQCVVIDPNKPNQGICRTLQGLDCDPQKTPCPGGYFCFKFAFVYRCVKPCDPTLTTDQCATNHECMPFDQSDPKKGYCILKRLPMHDKGHPCYYSRPEDPNYHGCKTPYVCIDLSCVDAPPATGAEGDACDAKRGCKSPLICTYSDTRNRVCAKPCNPYKTGECAADEVCVIMQADKFYWTGGCFKKRTNTQPLDAACKRANPNRPEYHDCQTGSVCVGNSGDTWCRTECDPASPQCPTTHTCTEYAAGKGACLLKREQNRDKYQTCGLSDEKDPGYHHCKSGLLCITFDDADTITLCVAACDTTNPVCDPNETCFRVDFFDPTKGACILNQEQNRKLGETCDGDDPRESGWHQCLSTLHCLKNLCVACLDDKHCPANQYCKANACVDRPGCSTDVDCRPPTPKCDTQAKKCVACLSNADCPADQICQNNLCQSPPGCSTDADCSAPTPKCNTLTKKCVVCLINADCPTNQICQNNICQPQPGCSTDADCRPPTPKCLTSTRQCVACLSDGDCPVDQVCQQNKCQPAPTGCQPACTADQYCFANQRCLPKWKECTQSSDCNPNETCTNIENRRACLPNCDPNKNTSATDLRNPACYGGYGICRPLSQSNQGVCMPPHEKTRTLNQSCMQLHRPEQPEYHDCIAGLECWKGLCLTVRTKTQPVGAKCNRDGTGSEHNDCVSDAVCVSYDDGGWCRKSCNPAAPQCPNDYDCVKLTTGTGACILKRTNTRKIGETCSSPNAADPGYHNCTTGLICILFDRDIALNLCMQTCSPNAPSCPLEHTCVPLESNASQGVCLSNRKRNRQANETCRGQDPRQADWHDCISGYGCVAGKCLQRTQSTGQACNENLLCKENAVCIVFDAAQKLNFCLAVCNPQQSACPADTRCVSISSTAPTSGACMPNRLPQRKMGEKCGANDLSKPEYHDCVTGSLCIGTSTLGFHCLQQCNPSAPTCNTGYRCLQLSVNSGACAQTCTDFSSCSYGSTCTDPSSSLGYKICL